MQKFVFPYKKGSESAKNLANKMNAKRIRVEGTRFKAGDNKVVINWGASKMPEQCLKGEVLNHPDAVGLVANKLHFFNAVADYNAAREGVDQVLVPEFTTDKDVAKKWGSTIVAREKLTGHSGEGIVLYEPDEDIGDAPLYVRYIPKKQEYRIHVLKDKVVDVQRKARHREVPNERVNWKIRNHHNGFIFARNEDAPVPDCVKEQAVRAVMATGLDFGAVDIVYNEKQGKAYVLEINTAPGLAGTTLENYAKNFKEYIDG